MLLPGKSHGWRSLVGCSPGGREESDTTERLHFHFPLSCIGEGNGNPLQCSCLDNPRDGEVWWAAIYGVAQSRTRLKRLSSSSLNTTALSFPLNHIWLCSTWSGLAKLPCFQIFQSSFQLRIFCCSQWILHGIVKGLPDQTFLILQLIPQIVSRFQDKAILLPHPCCWFWSLKWEHNEY